MPEEASAEPILERYETGEDKAARVRRLNGVAIVTPELEKLDLSTTAAFKQQMSTIADTSLVLDMDSIHFVDSSGLGAILSLLRQLNEKGGDLHLCCLQKRVRVMFELVRMHRVLNIHQTSDEAVAALEKQSAGSSEAKSKDNAAGSE